MTDHADFVGLAAASPCGQSLRQRLGAVPAGGRRWGQHILAAGRLPAQRRGQGQPGQGSAWGDAW